MAFRLLDLPLEVRQMIYSYALHDSNNESHSCPYKIGHLFVHLYLVWACSDYTRSGVDTEHCETETLFNNVPYWNLEAYYTGSKPHLELLRTCRHVKQEATQTYYLKLEFHFSLLSWEDSFYFSHSTKRLSFQFNSIHNLTFRASESLDFERGFDKLLELMRDESVQLKDLTLHCAVDRLSDSITKKLIEARSAGLLDGVGIRVIGRHYQAPLAGKEVNDLTRLEYRSSV